MTGVREPATDDVLEAPLIAAIDEDARELVRWELAYGRGEESIPPEMPAREAYAQVLEFGPGDALVEQGELTTRLYVVLSGKLVSSYIRGGTTIPHRELGPGDWFGETSALSHTPALSTVLAETPVRVLALDERLFNKLLTEDDDFGERIVEGYRRWALPLHLGTSPALYGLSPRQLEALAGEAELVRLDADEEVFAQGDDADRFFLVRSGAVRCDREEADGTTRVLAFYRANSSFGEHSLTAAPSEWPATATTMTVCDLVAIPRGVFERFADDTRRAVTYAANRVLDGQPVGMPGIVARCGAAPEDEVHVMVEGQSVKGGEALVIDLKACVRCNLCVESCVAVHDDGIPRLSKVGPRVTTSETLLNACYHCDVPGCMLNCEYGAIRRDPQGKVVFEYDNCVGCASCLDGCPYGVIRLHEPEPLPQASPGPWYRNLPLVGSWLHQPEPTAPTAKVMNVGGNVEKVKAKTVKCDLCAGLPFEACVYNCPTSAIRRRAPETLFGEERIG